MFFYYTKISGNEDDVVGITESNKEDAPVIPIQKGQVFLYDATTCTKVPGWTPDINDDGTATGELPVSGDFIIGTKYNPSDLKGEPAPAEPPVTYSFGTTLEGDPFQVESTIDLALK